MGGAAKPTFDLVLNGGGALVGLFQGQSAVHAHVGLDGDVVADAAGAQVVGLKHAWERIDDALDLLAGSELSVNSPTLFLSSPMDTLTNIRPTTIEANGSSTVQRSPNRIAPPMPMAAPIEDKASLR